MAERAGTFVAWVFALALIVVVPYAVFKGIEKDPGLLGSLATAFAAVIAVVLGRVYEKRLEAQEAHREKITPRYTELFERVADMAPKTGRKATDQYGAEFFRNLAKDLLFYGSDDVIKAWLGWQARALSSDEPNMGDMLAWEQVLFAIRKDLGHKNSGLGDGDLLRLYVKRDEVDAELAAWTISNS